MFAPANQSQFDLTVFGRQHDFKVLSFSGEERLNTPYVITVELVSEQANLDFQSLLHQLAFLSFTPESTWLPAEGVHGQIYSIGQRTSVGRLSRYTLVLVPHLTYLTHSYNQRIFQNKTVPDIISQVLDGHNIVTGAHAYFELDLRLYPAREYCVQYGESDLHFIQRLCEEEGLHFHFRHSRDGHTLIFGDDNAVFRALDRPTPYVDGRGMVADEPAIQDFTVRLAVRTTEVARRDYSFEKPHVTLGYGAKLDYGQKTRVYPDLEDYQYPGGFDNAKRGNFLADRSLERHRSDYQLAEGRSNQPTLRGGHCFELSEHSRADWNDRWLLLCVEHEGKQPQALEELIGSQPKSADGFEQGYRNHFTAIPGKTPYRPPQEHAKHQILGSQTAKVTGPDGEEIYCDAHGRIKVQFHWDRADKNNDKSSCWLRVASGWAGQRYGAVTIPRVGTEVLVTFQEGDPDRPLVTGCLHHVEKPVPYALPEHKTRSVFRSNSTPHTPGTSAFTELSIEDRAGQEKIFIQAERDLEQQIKHDYHLTIGNERQVTVKGNSGTLVEGRDSLTVSDSLHFRVGEELVAQAGQQIHLKAGADLILDADVSITLKAGGHHIVIGPAGIFSSTEIQLGGAPVSPLSPGALATSEMSPVSPPVVGASQRSIMAITKQHAAEFCPLCEACREGVCMPEETV
ncbi:type VI secretion system tip protein VgrG [Pseudomonas sp. LS1212]|uniref:type VI secretion system Vgr family protein n=1 Tax=Pseudomonas sp. LS1212 TaxID=2972478 RepID=UPI00215CED86|nr:type VI secretion system tip protein VgrG [Pseudomonas sp. LS1212]UVJ42176.1 type VI secretion system tip protein VgrG [Pseudomonas sp. LS1212]